VLGIDHVGSAHDEGQLSILLETARARLKAGQEMLPIVDGGPAGGRPIGEPVVEGTASLIVWEALEALAGGAFVTRRSAGSAQRSRMLRQPRTTCVI
jgi:hypothetical protein